MTTQWLQRFGAVSGVMLGLSIGVAGLIEAFTGEIAATSFVLGLGAAAFGAPALTGLYLRQSAVAGRFGAIAYAVNLVGLGLFAGVACWRSAWRRWPLVNRRAVPGWRSCRPRPSGCDWPGTSTTASATT
jgi:hypothetical protein